MTISSGGIFGTGPDTLTFTLSEDAYLGNAQAGLTIDGTTLDGTAISVTTLHNQNNTETFTYKGYFGAGSHLIGVDFLNDAYGGTTVKDRNLYISNITLNGVQASGLSGGAVEEYSNGTKSFTVSGGTNPPATSPTEPVTTGADTLLLNVSEDAYNGNAEFTVNVDGVAMGGTYTATGSHAGGTTNQVAVNGNFGAGPHTFGVTFINDAYAGTVATDRNLYVSSATYDGSQVTGAPVELASNGTANLTIGSTAPVTPTPSNAFYVSANGSASGTGTAANPFATLAQAQKAMEGSVIKTTNVEGGTYNLSSSLNLTSADNGETFIGVAGQAASITGNLQTLVNLNGTAGVTLEGLTFLGTSSTPSSDGQGEVNINGASGNNIIANHFINAGGDGLLIEEGASSNAVSGNEIDNSADSSIEIKDASNANVIDSNVLNGTSASNTTGGGVFGHGINNTVITHNVVENTVGMGIGIEDFGGGTVNSGNLIQDNQLSANNTASSDSGAIYLLGRSDNNTMTTVNMNFISEPTSNSANHTVGIYLDDYTSGVGVTNNIVGGNLSFDVQLHGGNTDGFTNNIFDTGSRATQVALIQAAPSNVAAGPLGTFNNDVISGNLNPSEHAGSGIPAEYDLINAASTSVNVSNNDYYGASGQNSFPDSSAKYNAQGFANQAGGNYNLTGGSGASSIGFMQINQARMGTAPVGAHYYA